MIGISTSPPNLSMARKFNTWYSVCDGYFTDPDVWISNGKKKNGYPQPGDDVYIYHLITFPNLQNVHEFSLHNVYVEGTLAFDSGGGVSTFSITGDLQANGIVDMTGATRIELDLYGVNNYINTFIAGEGTLSYNRLGDQDIMNLPYYNLIITGTGNKNIYNALTIGGTTIIGGLGTAPLNVIKKTFSGKLTFVGTLYSNGSLAQLDNTINADVEFQGGINTDVRSLTLNLGAGNLYFNGTQSIQVGGGIYHNYNSCLIMGSSILTLQVDPPQQSPFVINGSINGQTDLSTLNIDGVFWQATATKPMITGVYNYNHNELSIIGYVFDGDYSLPYTTYSGLRIAGNGTKTLGGNTTVNGNLILSNSGSLELSNYDFTSAGTTVLSGGAITKNTSAGYTKFIGQFQDGGSGNILQFDSSSIIEFQNGIVSDIRNYSTFAIEADCLIKFTTNDQPISFGGGNVSIAADVLISGPISITLQNTLGFTVTGSLNGDNSLSKFVSALGNIDRFFSYGNVEQPMQMGILDCFSNDNKFVYSSLGNQNITLGTYNSLSLLGGGTKKLLGNVSVLNTYVLDPSVTLDSNGYLLTNP